MLNQPAFKSWNKPHKVILTFLYITRSDLLIFYLGFLCLCSWEILANMSSFKILVSFLDEGHAGLIKWKHLYKIGSIGIIFLSMWKNYQWRHLSLEFLVSESFNHRFNFCGRYSDFLSRCFWNLAHLSKIIWLNTWGFIPKLTPSCPMGLRLPSCLHHIVLIAAGL